MRYIYVTFLLFIISIYCFPKKTDFRGMHGIQDEKGKLFFEYRGYNIVVNEAKGDIDKEKTVNNIIKENKLGTILANFTDSIENKKFRVIETLYTDKNHSNINVNNACYITTASKNRVQYLLFQTMSQRDYLLEKAIIESFYKGELDQYTQIGNDASEINFAGRTIQLGNLCRWISPNNIHCEGGQVSWSEFPSYQETIIENPKY